LISSTASNNPGKEKALVEPDRDIVFPWTPEAEKKGLLRR